MVENLPKYESLVWNCNGRIKMQQPKHLIKVIGTFFLTKIFMNKSVFLTELLWTSLQNFIPNKVATFNDKIHFC